MAYTETEENLKLWNYEAEKEAIIDNKRECCPKWGKAGSYDDCEECPAYNVCMDETVNSDKRRSEN